MKFFAVVFLLTLVACSQNANLNHVIAANNPGIINGELVTSFDPIAKHLVAITDNQWENCSGTLIAKNLVLTAAHCETPGEEMYVAFGLEVSKNNLKTVTRRRVTNYRLAPGRDKVDFSEDENPKDSKDLMILEFEGSLPPGYEPASILPDATALKDGVMVVLAGYGVTNGKKQTGDGSLRKALVPIDDVDYATTEIKTNERQRGSCNIDSGGPAFISLEGKLYYWGVTSVGDENCREFGIYTKVMSYQGWIDSVIRELALP